ncbi:MAG: DUF3667 domain-containing protein [Saprospiraceae bacterium]|nr:DUF3667 domain-containing protein [Saprospiraceae bacterium]
MPKQSDNNNKEKQTCAACGHAGAGNYCSNCGQELELKRITVGGLFVDAFQVITNLDSGFFYTLKQLITRPGKMQWDYIHRERLKHQKPFSMLFICASIAALLRYWTFSALQQNMPGLNEAFFYKEYWVLIHIVLLPFYSLIIYLFYFKSKYNYAEVGILLMYTFSLLFLLSGITPLLKFISPTIDTVFVEFPLALVYAPLTMANFFKEKNRWLSFAKGVVVLVIIFILIQIIEDFVYEWVS